MFFEHPTWLLGWWLVPAVAWLLVIARRRRVATAARFAEPQMLARLSPADSSARSAFKAAALLLGLTLLVTGAARPRWGVYFETVHAKGVDLFVLLDVSRSMSAEDVAPNRLLRAKSDIRDLLTKLATDRVGLIAFAGAPVVKVPLTTDHAFLQTVLDEVDPTSAPRGGSLIGDAIRKAIESMGPRSDRDRVIVLITDGEDHDSYPTEAAKQAAETGIKIFTVGLGDSGEGQRVPIRDKTGNLTYLQHDGREVWSKMDEKLLKEIAVSTGGAYIPAKTLVYDLGEIYSQHLQKLTRGELASEKRKRYGDRYQVFLVAGLALLVLDMLTPRFPKNGNKAADDDAISLVPSPPQTSRFVSIFRKTSTPQPKASRWALALGRIANRNVRGLTPTGSQEYARRSITLRVLGLFLLGLFLAPVDIQADAARDIRTGVASHRAGEFERAEKAFAEAEKQLPNHPVVLYDRACALAAMGKLDEAEALFQQIKWSDNPQIVVDSHYNLGCLASARAKAKFGDQPEEASAEVREEGIKLLEQAVMHYRDCLQLDRNHVAARHNLEVLRMWIKHMNDVWRQRDRDKARQELGLIEFLLMIDQRQKELLLTTEVLAGEPASPRRRQAATAASQAQRELSDEIVPLQEKIRAVLEGDSQPSNATGQASPKPVDPQLEQAVNQVLQQAQQVRSEMSEAAIELTMNLQDASGHQQKSLEFLDEIYRSVAPFEHLLQRSIQVEEEQVENTRPLAEARSSAPDIALGSDNQLPWTQKRVSSWIEALAPKAAIQLKQLESQVAQEPQESAKDTANQPMPQANAATTAEQKAYYQKGIDLGPNAHQAASEAVDRLSKQEWPPALAKEEEVVRLLKEIAESAPKKPEDQDQKQDQQPDQQQNQEQKKDDSQKNKQDEKPKQDDKQKNDDTQKKDDSRQKDSQNKSGEDQSKQPQSKDQGAKKPPVDPSREKAESLLRRVRQREREHKERVKELQAIIRGTVPVDKDW